MGARQRAHLGQLARSRRFHYCYAMSIAPNNPLTRARTIAAVAVFGAVWGGVECSLGGVFRSVAIPIHGSLMAGIGVVIMLTARRSLSLGRGACLSIGTVAAVLLPLSVSRGFVMAMIGVLLEATVLEAVLWFGRPRRWRCVLGGLLVGLVPPLQMLGRMVVYYGPAALSTFRENLLNDRGAERLGAAGLTAGSLLAVVLALSATFGGLCGFLGWAIGGQILKRLGRASG